MSRVRWFNRTRFTAFSLCVLGVLIASCEEECDDGSSDSPKVESVVAIEGDNATVIPSGTVSLTAEVFGKTEELVSGATIHWTTTCGTVPATSKSDKDGMAHATFTAPATPGVCTVTAQAGTNGPTDTFRITVTEGEGPTTPH